LTTFTSVLAGAVSIEQLANALGLAVGRTVKLESARGPVPVLVVDRLERPTADWRPDSLRCWPR
jgi:hypothetical protein